MNESLIPFGSCDELARAAAAAWLDEIQKAQREGKSHHVALSGGRIAQTFFASVVEQARARAVSFGGVHFFWADERCVPPTDAESNFGLARELLLGPLKIPDEQVHRIHGEQSPENAARLAEAEIRRFTPLNENGQPVLDLGFLGLGEDGHIASLFPGESEELAIDQAVYRAVLNSPKPPPQRVTLGYPAIAAARQIWMLVSGPDKEMALLESLSRRGKTPFARLLRLRHQINILTDIVTY